MNQVPRHMNEAGHCHGSQSAAWITPNANMPNDAAQPKRKAARATCLIKYLCDLGTWSGMFRRLIRGKIAAVSARA